MEEFSSGNKNELNILVKFSRGHLFNRNSQNNKELNLFLGMDKRTTHFFKTSLFQIDDQKNVDDRGDAEDDQKMLMPGLVSEDLHTQQTADRAAKNTQDQ